MGGEEILWLGVAAQQWRLSDRAAAGSCKACGEHSLNKE